MWGVRESTPRASRHRRGQHSGVGGGPIGRGNDGRGRGPAQPACAGRGFGFDSVGQTRGLCIIAVKQTAGPEFVL